MEINTKDFGIIQVNEDAVYQFPEGIYGFENDTQFAIFHQDYEDVSFLYLQSTRNPDPCFLVFEPWDLYSNYSPAIAQEELAALEANDVKELIFLTIATVPSSIQDLSINIKSPIVLNPKTRTAKQVILQNTDYTVRYKPFQKDGKEGA